MVYLVEEEEEEKEEEEPLLIYTAQGSSAQGHYWALKG